MSGLKIVVIGGGSSYTPELIEGCSTAITKCRSLRHGWWTLKRAKRKSRIIAELARRMIAKAGLTIEWWPPLTGKAALRDADFVCSQFRAGCP